jgi:hypothetical protein
MSNVTGLGRMAGGQGKNDPDFDYEHEERAEKRGQRTTGVLVFIGIAIGVAILVYRFAKGLPIVFPLG